MHCRFGVLHLGEVHARTKLERRRHAKRRPRTDYARAVLTAAPSDLYRAPDHVYRDRDRAWARRRNHRAAVSIREHLDHTALRGETHAPEVSRPIRCVSTARETADSLHPLATLFPFAFRVSLFPIWMSRLAESIRHCFRCGAA